MWTQNWSSSLLCARPQLAGGFLHHSTTMKTKARLGDTRLARALVSDSPKCPLADSSDARLVPGCRLNSRPRLYQNGISHKKPSYTIRSILIISDFYHDTHCLPTRRCSYVDAHLRREGLSDFGTALATRRQLQNVRCLTIGDELYKAKLTNQL